MLKRIPLALLLLIQALGGGAITLAHARDVVAAPPGLEARHDAQCAILHDEMRCALCHYAGTHMVTPQTLTIRTPVTPIANARLAFSDWVDSATTRTAPARAPPPFLS
ncbi:MAG TPA: hypothetical protein VFO67_18515 [Gemmatimonadales bacterium]|nr:hypothetical protein [Gemmatimonadales bacterium]